MLTFVALDQGLGMCGPDDVGGGLGGAGKNTSTGQVGDDGLPPWRSLPNRRKRRVGTGRSKPVRSRSSRRKWNTGAIRTRRDRYRHGGCNRVQGTSVESGHDARHARQRRRRRWRCEEMRKRQRRSEWRRRRGRRMWRSSRQRGRQRGKQYWTTRAECHAHAQQDDHQDGGRRHRWRWRGRPSRGRRWPCRERRRKRVWRRQRRSRRARWVRRRRAWWSLDWNRVPWDVAHGGHDLAAWYGGAGWRWWRYGYERQGRQRPCLHDA
jgi:hypothetical protein